VLSRAAAEELEQLLGPQKDKGAVAEPQEEEIEAADKVTPQKPGRTRKPKKEAA
jgi:hypothetical protein